VVVGIESYSQARLPDSDYTDKEKEKTNNDADDVESAALQYSDVIEHKAQDGIEADLEAIF
jgi:hypothetical protein